AGRGPRQSAADDREADRAAVSRRATAPRGGERGRNGLRRGRGGGGAGGGRGRGRGALRGAGLPRAAPPRARAVEPRSCAVRVRLWLRARLLPARALRPR